MSSSAAILLSNHEGGEDRPRGLLMKGPGLKLLHPYLHQVARDVVEFGETLQGLARNEV